MGDGQEATNRTLPTMYNVQSRVTNHESCAFVINLLRTQADVAPRQKQFRVLSSLSLSLCLCVLRIRQASRFVLKFIPCLIETRAKLKHVQQQPRATATHTHDYHACNGLCLLLYFHRCCSPHFTTLVSAQLVSRAAYRSSPSCLPTFPLLQIIVHQLLRSSTGIPSPVKVLRRTQ